MFDIKLENKFDFAAAEYADVFSRARASAFQSPVWLNNFYQKMPQSFGASPCIVTFRENGVLRGVVPMISRQKMGMRLLESADLGVSDYAAPVLDKELRRQLGSECTLRKRFEDVLGQYDILRIKPVREEHVGCWQVLFPVDAMNLNFSAHGVDVAAPFDEWRTANIDPKLNGQIKRKGKRWKKQHDVHLARLTDPQDVKTAIGELTRLREGRFENDPIQTDTVQNFYADVAADGANTDAAETWQVTSDGKPVGVVFGLTHKGRFLYLLIGADYDKAGRHSPGLQLYTWLIEDWIARGGNNFDFTIGDEAFKHQFGTTATPMSMFCIARGWKGALLKKIVLHRMKKQGAIT